MVIGKGTPYGEESEVDERWPSVSSDAALATHIDERGASPCTITGGDLLKTLGGGAPAGVSARAYPVDLLEVTLDGQRFVAVAHVIARRAFWSGRFFVAMNAAYADGLYLGPRSHPNDGLVDVTTGSLGWQQRVLARRRAATGTHLPHPDLSMTRTRDAGDRMDRPTPVRIDGVVASRATRISVTVVPDAGLVVV